MNPQVFTYSGVTVSYTEAQKAIVLADQNLLTNLAGRLSDNRQNYDRYEAAVIEAKDKLDNYCNTLKGNWGQDRKECIDTWNNIWNNSRNAQTELNNEMATINTQIASATKKLNDDINTIENDIKLQIQTQLANTAAANAAAANQANVSTAPIIAAGNVAATQTQLANEAAAAKLKQQQNIKVVEFIIIAVMVIAIGYFIFKRAS